MPDTYVVQPNDNLWNISKSFKVSFQELKKVNPQLALRAPPYGINPGDSIKLPPCQEDGDVRETAQKCCVTFQLAKPFLIALAKDLNIVPRVNLTVNDDVLNGGVMVLGQDATHGYGRAAPGGQSVGNTEPALETEMRGLLGAFASQDPDGKAKRLFDAFLEKNDGIEVFTDPDLDKTAAAHANIIAFCDRTLAAPETGGASSGKVRIHQALSGAGWDINKVKLIDDLGVPAFNLGSDVWRTEDYGNGLTVMINGVQYVYVYVEAYSYDSCKQRYVITLKFALYDVFGLDDDDLAEFGSSGGIFSTAPGRGFTAWWQLQHQFNYAPLLTKAVVYKTYTISTAGQ